MREREKSKGGAMAEERERRESEARQEEREGGVRDKNPPG